MPMHNLHWELLEETYSAASKPDGFTYRAKVPGGWLVAVTAGAGYEHGETNNLISNLKKKVDRRGRPEWVHKERAIQRAGQELRQVLDQVLRNNLDGLTIVPMPPSWIKTNPMYDDR
jgi:hypothetical protein